MTHHDHAGHQHPIQAPSGPSLLRFSAAERLALAAVIIALLWGALLWAMA
jgi:hypothetical protein